MKQTALQQEPKKETNNIFWLYPEEEIVQILFQLIRPGLFTSELRANLKIRNSWFKRN